MNIEDISIFGDYKQEENKLTSAFLQICKVGGEELIRFLSIKLKINLPSSEISIYSQVKKSGKKSVPDGLLQSNFAFNLYVESKIVINGINNDQLQKHKELINKENDYLLYLTPDEEKPNALENIHWANWKTILEIFNEYLENSQNDKIELLDFLIKNFNTFLDNLKVSKINWTFAKEDSVLIVAGSWAENIAINYNFYICQNKRSFKPSKYLTFYNKNEIRYLFEIINTPKDNIVLSKDEKFRKYIELNEPNYSDDKRKVFELKFIKELEPITNDKVDKNGNTCPYTYGQPRYTTIEKINSANKTSEL